MELLAKTCKSERMNLERLFARLLVAGGGLFWAAAAFGAFNRYDAGDEVLAQAAILLGVTVIVLVVGWLYENLAAVILLVLTVGFIVYGFLSPSIGEPGVWALWMVFTAAPAFAAAMLFLAASRMQKICELET